MQAIKLDTFTEAYVTCALWLTDEEPKSGAWLQNHPYTTENIDAESLARIVADCEQFQADNCADFTEYELASAGHDYFLTRNGHGAGFWDGDWEPELGRKLTTYAARRGESSLYIGDDGRLYLY